MAEKESTETMEKVMQKIQVAGVRFRKNVKIYNFDPVDIDLKIGDQVIVETARGLEIGAVAALESVEMPEKPEKPLKAVMRLATEEDIEQAEKLRQEESKAFEECERLVEKLKLTMKLISAEYNVNGSRLTIFFSAEGRVDFRELVRELSRSLKVRVEMRQIGPRDEARMLGGFGRCGRPLCCAAFLRDLSPVSIKMAKEQGLPLSPMKISGLCGRLLCCLDYEFDQYRAAREKMPKNGKPIKTPKGEGIVIGNKPIEEKVIIELESGARMEMKLTELAGEDKSKEVPKEEKKPVEKPLRRKHSHK